jgi:hypothetical protein
VSRAKHGLALSPILPPSFWFPTLFIKTETAGGWEYVLFGTDAAIADMEREIAEFHHGCTIAFERKTMRVTSGEKHDGQKHFKGNGSFVRVSRQVTLDEAIAEAANAGTLPSWPEPAKNQPDHKPTRNFTP